ncbi:ABC transporter substrate-binding protein [Frigoribacterium sp. ACAM 257]|uniref:ABC transporter substrate-binding protein n=1 Tax=Frigoribacterium sp. ACAM 257 TaxID=2508998 RepID=UPI0011B9A33D|nr:ABC transporter substrate-binding protein [Frigoribacterium sp. ACAM 257]TWX36259.1 ABC transporter substrate-binding protein [Frigoribacterium sp. ACAM 257]
MTALHRTLATTTALVASLALASCSSSDPLASTDAGAGAIVIGSQQYYSNEIIAEIFAQALEAEGREVDRQFAIGQREVYLPEIEEGFIDLFPEYTGPLLHAWDPDSTATSEADVEKALAAATPEGLRTLATAQASDQDAYAVTSTFAAEHDVDSVDDLAGLGIPLALGGNPEGADRPQGPAGLKAAYGVDVSYTSIDDSGGPLTIKALLDDDIQLAVVYTANPQVGDEDLVVLDDPEDLFISSHVVPLASDALDADAAAVIDEVTSALTMDQLLALNTRSVDEQASATVIARDWLADVGLD